MFKNISILVISLFALVSCGYSSIYSKNEGINFSISSLEMDGSKQINQYIEPRLKKFMSVKKDNDYEIIINTNLNRVTLAKDLKGIETDVKLITSLNLTLLKNKEEENIFFSKDFSIKKTSSNYEQNNYEKIIFNDLSKILLDEVIMHLSNKNDN